MVKQSKKNVPGLLDQLPTYTAKHPRIAKTLPPPVSVYGLICAFKAYHKIADKAYNMCVYKSEYKLYFLLLFSEEMLTE